AGTPGSVRRSAAERSPVFPSGSGRVYSTSEPSRQSPSSWGETPGPKLSLVGDLLVWIDCEMTGLDLGRDALIEVAALVTDPDPNVLGDGVDVVIHADDAQLAGMLQVVREMHDRSGLTEQVRASTLTVEEAEDRIMSYIATHVPEPRTAPLCGNS